MPSFVMRAPVGRPGWSDGDEWADRVQYGRSNRWCRGRYSLGYFGVRPIMRAGPRAHQPVFELRRGRPGTEACDCAREHRSSRSMPSALAAMVDLERRHAHFLSALRPPIGARLILISDEALDYTRSRRSPEGAQRRHHPGVSAWHTIRRHDDLWYHCKRPLRRQDARIDF